MANYIIRTFTPWNKLLTPRLRLANPVWWERRSELPTLLFLFAPKRTKIKIAPSPQVIQESADHLPQTVVQVVFDMEHEIAQVLSNNDPVSFLSFRVSIFFDAPRMSRAS
jgi:hypothetical protein